MKCCSVFERFLDMQDEKGLSIINRDSIKSPFGLMYRAVSKTDYEKVSSIMRDSSLEGNMTLDLLIAIKYCPWCGTRHGIDD